MSDNVFYCGEYGGGVHTSSARCKVSPKEQAPSKERAALVAELDRSCYSARAERYGSVRIGLSDALGILAALRMAPQPRADEQIDHTIRRIDHTIRRIEECELSMDDSEGLVAMLTELKQRRAGQPQGNDAEEAAKWRALRNCARITAMGSAGCRPGGQSFDGPTAHVTLNFWTHNERETELYPRAWLDVFVEKALAKSRESVTA